ncbi:unnamed protein product [Chrysoparadoxa australica]
MTISLPLCDGISQEHWYNLVLHQIPMIIFNHLTFRSCIQHSDCFLLAKPEGYDPRRSQINENHQGPALETFIRSPITGDLTEVPGVGKGNAEKLAEGDDKVTNTYQLIGKYLTLKGPDTADKEVRRESVECKDHCDNFWHWLKQKGIVSYRGSIVNAVAEKANVWMPGLYDSEEYGL